MGPSMMKPNRFHSLTHSVVYLPPHDCEQQDLDSKNRQEDIAYSKALVEWLFKTPFS